MSRRPPLISSIYQPSPIYPRRRSVMEIGAWIVGAAFMLFLSIEGGAWAIYIIGRWMIGE